MFFAGDVALRHAPTYSDELRESFVQRPAPNDSQMVGGLANKVNATRPADESRRKKNGRPPTGSGPPGSRGPEPATLQGIASMRAGRRRRSALPARPCPAVSPRGA